MHIRTNVTLKNFDHREIDRKIGEMSLEFDGINQQVVNLTGVCVDKDATIEKLKEDIELLTQLTPKTQPASSTSEKLPIPVQQVCDDSVDPISLPTAEVHWSRDPSFVRLRGQSDQFVKTPTHEETFERVNSGITSRKSTSEIISVSPKTTLDAGLDTSIIRTVQLTNNPSYQQTQTKPYTNLPKITSRSHQAYALRSVHVMRKPDCRMKYVGEHLNSIHQPVYTSTDSIHDSMARVRRVDYKRAVDVEAPYLPIPVPPHYRFDMRVPRPLISDPKIPPGIIKLNKLHFTPLPPTSAFIKKR